MFKFFAKKISPLFQPYYVNLPILFPLEFSFTDHPPLFPPRTVTAPGAVKLGHAPRAQIWLFLDVARAACARHSIRGTRRTTMSSPASPLLCCACSPFTSMPDTKILPARNELSIRQGGKQAIKAHRRSIRTDVVSTSFHRYHLLRLHATASLES